MLRRCYNQHEMSFGKYRAFLELAQYDASITVEGCHSMTMGEICQGHSGSNAADDHSTQHSDEHSGSHGHH